jgi:hypothetical protein
VTDSDERHVCGEGRPRSEGDSPGATGEDVDVSLIRWMLSLTPAERIRALEDNVYSLAMLRNGTFKT